MSLREGPAGWGSVAGLAVLTALLAPALNPQLLLVVPFALLALAVPPRRALVLAGGLVLLVLLYRQPAAGLASYFERGWALLLGAWFVLAVALLPGRAFLTRGLLALAGASATVLPFMLLNEGLFGRLELAVSARLGEARTAAAALFQRPAEPGTEAAEASAVVERFTQAMTDAQVLLFPALLALASLAALAVAWWGVRRIGAREAEPLRPLREFAFPNDLVWVLIIGIALVVMPGIGEGWARLGSNALTFMVALYALRGLAVLVVIGGTPGPLGLAVAVLAVLFVFPMIMAAGLTALVGLTDTWLDIRARRGART